MNNARAITKALGGRWYGSYGLCRCLVHQDREPSLKVKDDPNKADNIDVHCFAGCPWESVKGELVRQGLLTPFTPNRHDHKLHVFVKPLAPTPEHDEDQECRIALALNIWNAAKPLQGGDTLGWRYFIERRGLHVGLLDLDHCLRWEERHGVIVSLMTDAVTGEPCGIHRTFINADATKREKKMLGKQGVVRLSPDESVTAGLGLTEGIEDALAVLLSGWAPVWAATSCGAIDRFPVLDGIEALTIFGDDDENGAKAAEACAQHWALTGREAYIASIKELTT
ncbi:MAG: toprim domain-containing protein [Methyloceanibacter sp.]